VKAAHYLTHIEFDWTSPVWRHWLTELSHNHTLLRYDERGCGLSDWDAADLSFEGHVRDLEAVVAATGVTRFPLFGSSQGGAIAIAYAVRHPERVSHLVLCGAYVRGRLARAASQRERDEAELMYRMVELGWGKENPAFRQVFAMQFLPEGTPDQHRWFNDLQRLSSSPSIAARLLRVFGNVDICELAPKIACPTLIMHARDDERIPVDQGRQLAALIPGSRFVPLQSRNHILLEDEPAWNKLVATLRAFLPGPVPAVKGDSPPGALAPLSPRERQVLELIAAGLENDAIAQRLWLSEKTVRNHVTSIFGKLDVHSRAQAIVHARDAGLGYPPRSTTD
jgi:pimeloyl-ACP methyl ester carboxylesterase/DNA-binding CsgD family transcriptional regulator